LDKHPSILIIGFIFILAVAVCVAFLAGKGGAQITLNVFNYVFEISVFFLCASLAFFINWMAYIPAILAKTEHYYDLVGSITYLSVIVVAIFLVPDFGWRGLLVSVMVVVWALRLGLFLFLRVRQNGCDDRFDEVKVDPLKFLVAWSLQALWVLLTVACALAVITNGNQQPFGPLTAVGIFLWLFGFTVEVVADRQKSIFRKKPENKDKFIDSGLWAWSQHPNYFGEIVLWLGVTLIAIPVLEGFQWVVLVSPFFIYLLLTKGSGIPTLDEKAQTKWGANEEYKLYKKNTGLLFPTIPKSN